ncbi:MAG TPA: TIM-barrel domain-containing protein [Thermoanaerobaculia bacterium]|jgi:alpha-glucosidase
MADYAYVPVQQFTPNTSSWTTVGNIDRVTRNGDTFVLTAASGLQVQVSFLADTAFRVRFSPTPGYDFSVDRSFAVVSRNLGPLTLTVTQQTASTLEVTTASLRVAIGLQPFLVQVFRGNQLISSDQPGQGLVYIPGEATANFKVFPANALYVGFGEKAGNTVVKNEATMTQFNFDNFSYGGGNPNVQSPTGPLSPQQPLYISIPVMVEVNPNPVGANAGPPYACGTFVDNLGQSYFNMSASSDLFGKWYFGALYGELDYYVMVGDATPDVLRQYTTLTGRAPMPPKYVFGYHQGCYGYFDRWKLAAAAYAYRAARIPLDGLHIDVDFQNNYRTFTHSEMKFPNVRAMMDELHESGFKCSTNITPLMTENTLDENGNMTPYVQMDAMRAANYLLFNTRDGMGPSNDLFEGTVSYGSNRGNNPYPYPGRQPQYGIVPLGATGYYSNYGDPAARECWGQQYAHLVDDVGMDMIWQDMMCPAMTGTTAATFPLDLHVFDGNEWVPNAFVHNYYGIALLMATWEGLGKLRPGTRNFIIARGGYAGMQRYAAAWTGDSASDWNFLAINIPQVINLGLSGVPLSGTDIGGFATGAGSTDMPSQIVNGQVIGGITNYELLTRWIQLGSFMPWFRNHYDGYNKQFQEVYEYGEPVPTNCRTYIELRYRMLQVYYDAMYEWTQSGMPIVRPLFLNDPQDPNSYVYVDDQCFVGRDFLVAPIVAQHATASPPSDPVRSVYLPAGSQWYAFQDNKAPLFAPVNGGTLIQNWYAGLDRVPIYVRAGAILPFRELEQWVGQLSPNPLTINIYPGADSTYQLYQDDGISTQASTAGAVRVTEISHQGIGGGQNVRVRRVIDQFTPAEPFYYLALLGTRQPSSVAVGDAQLQDAGDATTLARSPVNTYYWNSSIQITFVKMFDTSADVTVTALF